MVSYKKSWPCFDKPQLCRNHIYVIAIVKIIQNLFNVANGICMDSRKLFNGLLQFSPGFQRYNF